jgi:hypothetical protein
LHVSPLLLVEDHVRLDEVNQNAYVYGSDFDHLGEKKALHGETSPQVRVLLRGRLRGLRTFSLSSKNGRSIAGRSVRSADGNNGAEKKVFSRIIDG